MTGWTAVVGVALVASVLLVVLVVLAMRRARALAPAASAAPREFASVQPTRFIVGPETDPLLCMEVVPDGVHGDLERVPLTPSVRQSLAPILDHLPRLGISAAHASERTVSLVLSPALQARLANGSAEMMASSSVSGGVHGVVVDKATGRILGQGSLVSTVDPAALVAAAWQVAAVVTAQRFLIDILHRLDAIGEGVKQVEQWLQDELVAKIEADHAHLVRVAKVASPEGLSAADRAAYASTLEHIERDNAAAMGHLERTLGAIPSALEAHTRSAWTGGGLAQNLDAVRVQVGRYEQLLQAYMVAAWIRLTAARLRVALGMNAAHARAISVDVLAELRATMGVHPDAVGVHLGERAEGMVGTFSWASTNEGVRKEVADLASRCSAKGLLLSEVVGAADELTGELERFDERRRGSLALLVTLDPRGEPVALLRTR